MLHAIDRRRLVAVPAAACIAGFLPAARAQAWPTKPIRILIPASSGTTGDILSRLLAGPMEKALGQPFVVEAMPGAGGVTATDRLVRSPKDGYTVAMASSNHVINPSIYKSIPFDSIKDITPITVVASTPMLMAAHPSLPAANARELIALAKAKPGQLTYGSGGNGSVLHLAGVLFVTEGGVDIKHVPYKGYAPMVADLLGGHIHLGIGGAAPMAEHIRSGKLRAMGVTTKARWPVLPDVPSLAEAVPSYDFDAWLALIGPAGLPKPIVDRLRAAVQEAFAVKEVQDTFASMGVTMVGSTPEQSARFFQTELDKHAQLVKRSGATLE